MAFDENTQGGKVHTGKSDAERKGLHDLRLMSGQFEDFVNDTEWNLNKTFLFASRQTISRLFYFNDLYERIVNIPGVICEFGVQYGATLTLLTNLRGIHEPFNYMRKIIGFDTFSGFTEELTPEEKKLGWEAGDYSVPDKYPPYLEQLLETHEQNAPIPHKKKFELIVGDVIKTFDDWLADNPQTVISLAIFDMDAYAPTKHVLKRVMKRIPKGGILAFDELSCDLFPGETQAVMEVLEISNLKLEHHPHNPLQAWCVIE